MRMKHKSVFVSQLQVTKPKWDDFADSSLQNRHMCIYMYMYTCTYTHICLHTFNFSLRPGPGPGPDPKVYVRAYIMYVYVHVYTYMYMPLLSWRSQRELRYRVFVFVIMRTSGQEAFWQSYRHLASLPTIDYTCICVWRQGSVGLVAFLVFLVLHSYSRPHSAKLRYEYMNMVQNP